MYLLTFSPKKNIYFAGQTSSLQDVQSFTSINVIGPCSASQPPTCSAILISDLQFPLHAYHEYFITLRVTNVAGFSSTKTSEPFKYVQLPTKGLIFDVPPEVLEDNETKVYSYMHTKEEQMYIDSLFKGLYKYNQS